MSLRIVRPKVDLPQPDSPTMPSVSPASTVRLTPSTALSTLLLREKSPSPTGKCFLRFRTSNRLIVLLRILQSDVGIQISCLLPLSGPESAFRVFIPSPWKIACHPVARLLFQQLRFSLRADGLSFGATIAKAAPARQIERARHDARDRVQTFFLLRSRTRERIQQAHRIRMKGSRKD